MSTNSRERLLFLASLLTAIPLCGLCVYRIVSERNIGVAAVDDSMVILPVNIRSSDVIGDARYIKGDIHAATTLVEFGDYQCPPCRQAYERTKRVVEGNSVRLRFVFRNLPLTRLHPFAKDAAVAAEAAGEQGKYWEMHALLYTGKLGLTPASLESYANSLHLSMEQFRTSVRTTAKVRVENDMRAARKLGLNGTPTFALCEANGNTTVTTLSALERRFATGWLQSLKSMGSNSHNGACGPGETCK